MATKPPAQKTPNKTAAIIAAAVLVATPVTVSFEGYSAKAYRDPAGYLTQCYGETQNVRPDVIYTKQECTTKLRTRMAKDYAPGISACIPQLVDMKRVKIFGALLDASYNAGIGGVCRSRMADSIRAGRWAQACNGFYGWRATATDRRTGRRMALPGLTRRRAFEAALCKEGLKDGISGNASQVAPKQPVANGHHRSRTILGLYPFVAGTASGRQGERPDYIDYPA